MFDVFERTSDLLAPLLVALFNDKYGEFDTRLTFVISGRDPLEQHWTELAGLLCQMRLEPFTLEKTHQYLGNQKTTDDRIVTRIQTDTGGLPVLVELLAATKPQAGVPLPDISKDAVERFLQWTPKEERRQVALLAAVPRQFNRDILSAVLGYDATSMFNWLAVASTHKKLENVDQSMRFAVQARALFKSDDWYNLACLESVCGNVDAAIEHLRRAARLEKFDRDWAKRDPDFEWIRDDPRFAEIVGT